MRVFKTLIGLAFILFTSIACQTSSIQQKPHSTDSFHLESIEDIDYRPTISAQSEQLAKQLQEVDDAIAVVIGDDISIALQVTGFNRFRLEQIKKKAHQRLEKKIDGPYQIHITTDKKLFKSLKTLRHQLDRASEPGNELLKKFKKINRDMHG